MAQEELDLASALEKAFPSFRYFILINKIKAEAIGIRKCKFFTFSVGESIH